jgi:hypothetical protein
MAAMGRNFYSNFVVCPKADLGVHCSIRKFGLRPAVRCAIHECPVRAVRVSKRLSVEGSTNRCSTLNLVVFWNIFNGP